MDKIINYFVDEIQFYSQKLKEIESDIKSKKIVSSEIKKAIERLSSNDDAISVFSANESDSKFNNKEIEHLKNQEEKLSNDVICLQSEYESVNNKILTLKELLNDAKDIAIHNYDKSEEINNKENINNIVLQNDSKKPDIEKVIDDLRNVSNRIDFASKLIRTDCERCKMELGLARMKILFCMDELNDNVSRETL